MKTYRPLKDYLTIRRSDIEGLGLFATDQIWKGANLGITHFRIHAQLHRTPLGGFYNHSVDPNCEKIFKKSQFGEHYELVAIKDIKADEEITVKYTLSKLPKGN